MCHEEGGLPKINQHSKFSGPGSKSGERVTFTLPSRVTQPICCPYLARTLAQEASGRLTLWPFGDLRLWLCFRSVGKVGLGLDVWSGYPQHGQGNLFEWLPGFTFKKSGRVGMEDNSALGVRNRAGGR